MSCARTPALRGSEAVTPGECTLVCEAVAAEPLDTTTIFSEIGKTGRLVTVEENPRLCGWGAEVSSIVAEERFWDLDMPILRITTPHIPLPSSEELEDIALPSVARIFETVRNEVD